MAIKLHFDNPNPAGVRLDIYRDTAEIDRNNLPTPIFTTTDHITEWVDETVIKGLTYYYVFKTTGELDSKTTRNIKLVALDDKGVGDDKLYYGNLNYGYYGNFAASTFFTGAQLLAALGLTFTTTGNPSYYHKWAHEGKTVFVPNTFIGKGGHSYNTLVAAGLIEGIIIQHSQFRYRVRLMKGYDAAKQFGDKILAAAGTYDTSLETSFVSEYDKFVFPVSRYVPKSQITHNVDAQTQANFGYAANVQFLMAEVNGDGTLALTRGNNTESSTGLTMASAVAVASSTAYNTFLPIIELITDEV